MLHVLSEAYMSDCRAAELSAMYANSVWRRVLSKVFPGLVSALTAHQRTQFANAASYKVLPAHQIVCIKDVYDNSMLAGLACSCAIMIGMLQPCSMVVQRQTCCTTACLQQHPEAAQPVVLPSSLLSAGVPTSCHCCLHACRPSFPGPCQAFLCSCCCQNPGSARRLCCIV